jgi:hypothetical protein
MTFDRNDLRVLNDRECYGLLATAPLARTVFTHRALRSADPASRDGETTHIERAGTVANTNRVRPFNKLGVLLQAVGTPAD